MRAGRRWCGRRMCGSSEALRALLAADPLRLRALECVRGLGLPDAWVAAGAIRSAVWDAAAAAARPGAGAVPVSRWAAAYRPRLGHATLPAMRLSAHDRYDHSAIIHRPDYAWPNGARLALLIVNNIEHFHYREGLGSDSTGPATVQNQRPYAWRDYGNRVGLWNLLALLDELALPAAHNCNATVLDHCPEIAPALLARGDELVGHGRTNSERQDGLGEADERALIEQSRDALIRHGGRPRGWLGPYIAQSAADARPAGRGRLRLLPGLAGRRPAVLDADAGRPHPLHPLQRRTERQPGDGDAAPHRPRIRRDGDRPVRRNAGTEHRPAAGDEHRAAPLHHRPAAPVAAAAPRPAAHPAATRKALDRQAGRDVRLHVAGLPAGSVP